MLVRAAGMQDLDTLLALAASAGSGLTTLPASEGRLVERLECVAQSFAGAAPQADADYLFVLENEQGRVVGTKYARALVQLPHGVDRGG